MLNTISLGNRAKTILCLCLTSLSFLSFAQNIDKDQQIIIDALDIQMETLVNAINASDSASLSSLISANATESVKGVPARLKGNKIEYTIGEPTYEPIDGGRIKSTWEVSSESTGINGNVSITGFSHNAIFEKQGDAWKIIDGSFDPTSLGSVGWIIGLVFGILGLIFLPLGILWIFMLIHAAKHDINNKVIWIILMCFIGFPVSVIYFFTERKKYNALSRSSDSTTTAQQTPPTETTKIV